MPWRYEQSTGRMYWNGQPVQQKGGYSGKGRYKNVPTSQNVLNHGPIPQGQWNIGGVTAHKGPVTITLTPKEGTQTFGRDNFRIHGDSKVHPGEASEGCIIMTLETRNKIVSSGDTTLEVVP